MAHALIIDDNSAISRGIESRLFAFGFNSFDHTWTERQALEAAKCRVPDLIVVGDHIADASALSVAKKVALATNAPVLALTGNQLASERAVPTGASVEGPFSLSRLGDALARALPANRQ
jgi:DNA-binding response OmpR family regulator